MCPASADTLAGYPESQVVILGVSIQYVLDDFRITAAADTRDDVGTALIGLESVAVSELEELEVGILVVGIADNALQSAEEECLTQGVQILAERVEKFDKVLAPVAFQSVIVGTALQTVVQDFAESLSHELLTDDILQFVALVRVTLDGEAALEG